jgi:hypothetical protein
LSWLLTKSRPQNTNLLAKLNTFSPSEAKRRLTDFRYNAPDHIVATGRVWNRQK